MLIVQVSIRHCANCIVALVLRHHFISSLGLNQWLMDLWRLSVPAHRHRVGWFVAHIPRCRALAINGLIVVRVCVYLVVEGVVVAYLGGAAE